MVKWSMHTHTLRAVALAAALVLSACSFAPTYHAPATAIPTHFKEAGDWQTAQPSDRLPRDGWWRTFDDPVLNQLEPQVAKANPDIAAALARHDEADALVAQARSALLPTIGAEANVSRVRQSALRPLRGSGQPNVYDSNTLDVGIGYDLDLWGKVRNEVKAGEASSTASEADIASLQLSLQAKLATTWFDLLGLDQQSKLLDDTIAAYRHALELTESRHRGGIASSLDVSRAQTQLASAQAAADDVSARRALYEHAIATLVGVPASQFNVAPDTLRPHLPNLPAGLPSALLQRRPDIAAAERRVAAANAQIGVARSAYFPDITLSPTLGWESTRFGGLFSVPSLMWSVGATAGEVLFDGGKRAAGVDFAQAGYESAQASYRQTVLTAFQEVQNAVTGLSVLDRASTEGQSAVDDARKSFDLANDRYQGGLVAFIDVLNAEQQLLASERQEVQIHGQQVATVVYLAKALGGGWSTQERELACSAGTCREVPNAGADTSVAAGRS